MKLREIIKNQKLLPDIINVILGFVVIVLFILVMIMPEQTGLTAALMMVAGLMNVTNAYRKSRQNSSKVMIAIFGAVGVIMIAFGIYYFRLAIV